MRLVDADKVLERSDNDPAVVAALADTPTYKPERGKWFPFNVGDVEMQTCSHCGGIVPLIGGIIWKHCPECGNPKL